MDIGLPLQEDLCVLDRLARRTASFPEGEITPQGRALVHAALVDTLGVGIAGAASDPVRMAADALGPRASGESLVVGTAERTNAMDAGLLNGIAAHALDFDDGNSIMAGHPSTMLVPAILALAEERQASARDVVVAYAAGYEVIIRLSRAVNMHHYEKGWHPTATIGVFGVAAACARLLNLDAAQTATALGIACSMASGIKANFGTMVKSLHIGHGIRDGIYCAKLAAAGFTANTGALEARQGFLQNFNGAGNFDLAAMLDGLDEGLEVNRETNKIKLFACCASTHASVDAGLSLHHKHAVRADNIARLVLRLHPRRIPHTDRSHLQEALSGKFSQQYLVARAICDGAVSLDHFRGDAHCSPAVVALMPRVRIEPADEDELPHAFAASLRAELHDGRVIEVAGDRPNVGVTGPEQMASPRFWFKFEDCARQGLGEAGVQALVAGLQQFDGFDDIRTFTTLMERPTGAPTAAARP